MSHVTELQLHTPLVALSSPHDSHECGLHEAKHLVQFMCRSPDITNEGSRSGRIGCGMFTEFLPMVFIFCRNTSGRLWCFEENYKCNKTGVKILIVWSASWDGLWTSSDLTNNYLQPIQYYSTTSKRESVWILQIFAGVNFVNLAILRRWSTEYPCSDQNT